MLGTPKPELVAWGDPIRLRFPETLVECQERFLLYPGTNYTNGETVVRVPRK